MRESGRHGPRVTPTVFLTLFLGACGGVPDVERDLGPLVQTSELRYRIERHDVGYRVDIPYSFRNETGDTVFLDHCAGDVRPLLQVQRGDLWVDAWFPFRWECGGAPIRIEPGGRFGDTLRVIGAPPGSNVLPAFVFEEVEGVYRLLLFQARAVPLGPDTVPGRIETGLRVSNPFVLSFR